MVKQKMWNQLRKIAVLGDNFTGYHCTNWRNAEAILKSGFRTGGNKLKLGGYFETHFWDFYEMIDAMDRDEELVEAVESGNFYIDNDVANLLADNWWRVFGDKGTLIWITDDIEDKNLERVKQFGDTCLKVKIPEGSYMVVSDHHYGSCYYVPMVTIPPQYFEVVGGGYVESA